MSAFKYRKNKLYAAGGPQAKILRNLTQRISFLVKIFKIEEKFNSQNYRMYAATTLRPSLRFSLLEASINNGSWGYL